MQINRILTQTQFVLRYAMLLTALLFVLLAAAYYVRGLHTPLSNQFSLYRGQPVQIEVEAGTRQWRTVRVLGLTPAALLEAGVPHLIRAAWALLALGVVSLSLVFVLSLVRPTNTIHRGTHIRSAAALRRWIRQQARRRGSTVANPPAGAPRSARFALGHVPFPVALENLSVLGFGSPGSGKSVLLNQVIRGSRPRMGALRSRFPGLAPYGGLVYDRADLTEVHYRPGLDFLLDPYCDESVHINLFDELTDQPRLNAFCAGFYPVAEATESAFWQEIAQSLLEASMKLHIAQSREADRRPTMEGFAELLMEITLDLDTFRDALMDYPATWAGVAHLLGEPGQELSRAAQSAFITFSKDARLFLNPVWQQSQRPNFSPSRFLALLTHTGDFERPFLYVRNRAEHEQSYKKIYSAFLNLFFTSIISQHEPRPWPRIQILLDEWPSLQRLSALPPLLAEGRKYGLLVIALAQSPKQVELIYQRQGAAALFATFGTHIFFRQADSDSAEALSRLAGDAEQTIHSVSTQLNEHQLYGSLSTNENRQVRRSLLASEIMGLQDLEFYARLPNAPWLHDRLPRQFHPRNPAVRFTRSEFPDEIFNPPAPGPAPLASGPAPGPTGIDP